MKTIILSIFLLCASLFVLADSPLTSTSFYSAYQDLKQVEYALENGMDKKVVKILGSKKTDIVTKIAVINAMSWGDTTSVVKFEEYLLKKRKGLKPETFDYLREIENGLPEDTDQTLLLTADDLTCWAYLQCMGDYFNPSYGMNAANLGFGRDYMSMAHALPLALIASQVAFDFDWCSVYEIPYAMLINQEYSENIVTDEAINIVMDYINLYKVDCE
jgi:hypothetical protein